MTLSLLARPFLQPTNVVPQAHFREYPGQVVIAAPCGFEQWSPSVLVSWNKALPVDRVFCPSREGIGAYLELLRIAHHLSKRDKLGSRAASFGALKVTGWNSRGQKSLNTKLLP